MSLKSNVVKVAKKVAVGAVAASPWWQYYEPEIPKEVTSYHNELKRKHDICKEDHK